MEPAGAARARPELVYQLAGALGTELQRLASRFGSEAAAGLVPPVVRALELLEGAAGAPRGPEEAAEAPPGDEPRAEWPPGAGPGGRESAAPAPDERLLLRQLKQVIDRQRDQLRAQSRDLQLRGQEVEALQEQLQRLLRVNGELRCKLAAVQVQLRAAQQRAAEAEGARAPAVAQEAPEGTTASPGSGQEKPEGFSREEVSRILQERHELKANLFLLQEELNYYQRELLADRRVPGLLLDAMRLTVKRQRRKIKAKMLGTPDGPGSGDEEDADALWLPPPSVEGTSPPSLPGSRIRSFFSFWYWGNPEPSSELPPTEDLTHPQEEPPAPPPVSSGGTP